MFLAEVRSKRPAREISRELHRLLLEPIGEYTGKQPPRDRSRRAKLHLLPFDAQIGADGRRILASHIVSYAPSAHGAEDPPRTRAENPRPAASRSR